MQLLQNLPPRFWFPLSIVYNLVAALMIGTNLGIYLLSWSLMLFGWELFKPSLKRLPAKQIWQSLIFVNLFVSILVVNGAGFTVTQLIYFVIVNSVAATALSYVLATLNTQRNSKYV